MVVGGELAALEAEHGEPRLALEFFDEVVTWLDQAGDLANLAGVLGWVVVLLDRLRRHEAAATLYGTHRERLDAVTWVGLPVAVDHLRDALREERFEELARRGGAMEHREAMSYAHQVLRDALEEVGTASPA